MMAISREELHRIIDQIPENKLPPVKELLSKIYETEHLSADEASEVDEARKRILNGEYSTFEDVFGDLNV